MPARKNKTSPKTRLEISITSTGEHLMPEESVDVLYTKTDWPNTLSSNTTGLKKAWIKGYRVWQTRELNPTTGKTVLKKLRPSTREMWRKGAILVYRKAVIAQLQPATGEHPQQHSESIRLELDSRPTAMPPDRVRRHQPDAITFEQFYDTTPVTQSQGVVLNGVEKAEVEDLRLGSDSFSLSTEAQEDKPGGE